MLGEFPSFCIVLIHFKVNHALSYIATGSSLVDQLPSVGPELVHEVADVVRAGLPLARHVPQPWKDINGWISTWFNSFQPLEQELMLYKLSSTGYETYLVHELEEVLVPE